MKRMVFRSGLREEFRGELEALLFFSPDQGHCTKWISNSVGLYGVPRIRTAGGLLRASLAKVPWAQSLFALEHEPLHDRLVGTVIYARDRQERITVAYLAVAHDHVMSAALKDVPLAIQLCSRVMDVAERISGVTALQIVGGQEPFIRIPLRDGAR